MRRRRGRKSNPTTSIVLVLLIITLLAIGTGYFLSSFLISSFSGRTPTSNKPGSVTVQPEPSSGTPQPATPTTPATVDPSPSVPASTTKVTPVLPSVYYGHVQMGAFAQESNATNLAGSLKSQGFPASVVKRNNLYRVIVGVFAERSIADDYKKSLEAKGFQEILLSSTELHLTTAKSFQGEEADLIKVMEGLVTDAADITSKLLQISDQLYDKSVDQSTWLKSVGALADKVADLEKIQLPAVQSTLSGNWYELVADLQTHLANQTGRRVGDLAAWASSQIELMNILSDLQALYSAMSL